MYNLEVSTFIRSIILLLKKKKQGYIFDLITQISRSAKLKVHLFSFQNLFSILLEKDDVDSFIKELSKIENGKRLALLTLQQIKFSERPFSKEIYEEGRKYFENEYAIAEKSWSEHQQKRTKDNQSYIEFKFRLEPEAGKYINDVFRFFLVHKEELESQITQQDKKRLKYLIESSIFDKFNPGQHDLTIQNKANSGITYSTHAWISIFGDAIEVARELGLNYRKAQAKDYQLYSLCV